MVNKYNNNDDYYENSYYSGEEPYEDNFKKRKRGPKRGKRRKIVFCKEFEAKVVPLFNLRNIPKGTIDDIISKAILTKSFIITEIEPDQENDLTLYLKEYHPKNKNITSIFKAYKGPINLEIDLSKAYNESLSNALIEFRKHEKEINDLKAVYVWKCWDELEQRCKNIAKSIIYTKSLFYEEAENLIQDTILYFHHLHTRYDPYFIEGKTMPYQYYMLSMVRQKLRYHVQAYHIKKNKEDLKEEISDFDMTANYINMHMSSDSIEGHDLRQILKEIEEELPSDKHRLVFEMLKDGHKQKSIAKAIDYTQSWVSIIKKKIRAAIIKKVKTTSQENLLEERGINLENYKNEDLDNIWE